MIRLTFGKDPPTTKRAFIHWIGPEASAVKRGQWNSKSLKAQDVYRQYMTINVFHTATSRDELSLTEIIETVKRLSYDAADEDEGITHSNVVKRKRASLLAR